ncbi:hypothetical protein [Kitasatospora cineracea]|uniref:hypothetical protein n=1 Tax=Kitasatospora cineracea TaxID=88074 RepID=UPI00379D299C
MFRKALPALAAGILTVAAALGAASPASASTGTQAHAAGHRGLVWTYDPAQHIIKIHDSALFATELCTGTGSPLQCARTATACANTFRAVNQGWYQYVNPLTGKPKCPRAAGTHNSQLGQDMKAVISYWASQGS